MREKSHHIICYYDDVFWGEKNSNNMHINNSNNTLSKKLPLFSSLQIVLCSSQDLAVKNYKKGKMTDMLLKNIEKV